MKSLKTGLFACLFSFISFSQTPILEFDGIDDYVGFGTDAASNARTIEFWFKLTNSVDENLQNEIFLFGTEVTGDNLDEWHVTITRAGTANPPGTVRFAYVVAPGQVAQVFSDSTSWAANQWYHVAVVIDQNQGMIMFIDGNKQNEIEPNFTSALMPNGANVEAGRQLNYTRYFDGAMDGLRTSSTALYLNDFTPPCPDLTANGLTIGLWNFNENSGSTTADSHGNNDGQIFGASWSTADICRNSDVSKEVIESSNYYPNPSTGIVYFDNISIEQGESLIIIYNTQGEIVLKENITTPQHSIDLSNKEPGIYSFQIISNGASISTGRIGKQ